MKFGFQITRLDQKRIYYLAASSEAEKNEWIAALEDIIQRYLLLAKKSAQFLDLKLRKRVDSMSDMTSEAAGEDKELDSPKGIIINPSNGLKQVSFFSSNLFLICV